MREGEKSENEKSSVSGIGFGRAKRDPDWLQLVQARSSQSGGRTGHASGADPDEACKGCHRDQDGHLDARARYRYIRAVRPAHASAH